LLKTASARRSTSLWSWPLRIDHNRCHGFLIALLGRFNGHLDDSHLTPAIQNETNRAFFAGRLVPMDHGGFPDLAFEMSPGNRRPQGHESCRERGCLFIHGVALPVNSPEELRVALRTHCEEDALAHGLDVVSEAKDALEAAEVGRRGQDHAAEDPRKTHNRRSGNLNPHTNGVARLVFGELQYLGERALGPFLEHLWCYTPSG